MKKVQSDKFKTKHMKKNVRASPARKDQFTREYIKINVQICPCLICIVVQPEIKEHYRYQKGSIFRTKRASTLSGWKARVFLNMIIRLSIYLSQLKKK